MTQTLDTGTVDTGTVDTETLADRIQQEFSVVQLELLAARGDQRRKDTPAARARVRAHLERLDAVLDMWNDVLHAGGGTAGTGQEPGQEPGQERSTATFSAPDATGSSNRS